MRTGLIVIACSLVIGRCALAEERLSVRDANWPQWRGPLMTGVAPNGNPPVEWSESKNIHWKVEIPGRGHATPIVWGERVFIQTAVRTDQKVEGRERVKPSQGRRAWMGSVAPTHIHEFTILALDRQTGRTVWQRVLRKQLPHEGGHQDASQASNSPATDGEHIIAFFGSRGLYCLDMQGKVLWTKDLGKMETRMGFGEGSSPVLYGDTVVVNWDHEGQSFVAAFDKHTGKQRWKVDRDEATSWATPIVVEANGAQQVVTSATNRIRSYDLATGSLRWQCGGMTRNVVPTPVRDDGLLFLMSGFRGSALLAVRLSKASGDITDSNSIAWTYGGNGTSYVPSPLLYEGSLYFLHTNKAILSCVNAKTGEPHYTQQRLEGLQGVYASPVAANHRIYIAGRGGKVAVIESAPKFKLLVTNTLDEGFAASPAIAGDEIFLRGRKHLYCIAADQHKPEKTPNAVPRVPEVTGPD